MHLAKPDTAKPDKSSASSSVLNKMAFELSEIQNQNQTKKA